MLLGDVLMKYYLRYTEYKVDGVETIETAFWLTGKSYPMFYG